MPAAFIQSFRCYEYIQLCTLYNARMEILEYSRDLENNNNRNCLHIGCGRIRKTGYDTDNVGDIVNNVIVHEKLL